VRLGGSPVLHLARVVIVGLLSLSSLAQPALQKVSLEIGGATVWLGMPRQEVINRCTSAGLKQMTADRNSILFKSGGDFYSVQFKNGRLVFATRDWLPSKAGLDALQTTMVALASISESDSVSACTISHHQINNPATQANQVFIACGKRSFLLEEGKVKGEPYYSLSERIGEAFTTE